MSGIIRFAPSPTGYLHEGHLLSALYVWAAAKKWNLKVHLRIEDHDQSRARPAYIAGIREDLAWLGFHYDSESIQSARSSVYEAALRKLEAKSLVYPCYCSRKQLQEENPKSETGEIVYQGKCFYRRETRDGVNSVPHNLRFIVPNRFIDWHDLRLGDFHENPKMQCGDFPIRDRENQWTYQFAVCVDDIGLPFGQLRLKPSGSDGGHNGLKHIAQILGTQQYARLRFGIGNDFFPGQQADYVLSRFTDEQEALIPECTKQTTAAIKTFCLAGIQMAMNQLNRKK